MVLLLGGYGHLSCSEPSDFPLLRLCKKHLAGKRFAADAEVKQAVTSLDTDTLHQFLLCQDAILGAMLRQMFKCHGGCVGVWCVTPATHVPCVHQSENNFFLHLYHASGVA